MAYAGINGDAGVMALNDICNRLVDVANEIEAARMETYDGMTWEGVDEAEVFCPMTRRPCMGKHCVAAVPSSLSAAAPQRFCSLFAGGHKLVDIVQDRSTAR